MSAFAFLVAIVAFLLFGLATARHHDTQFGSPCPRRRASAFRRAAWTCLIIGFCVSLHHWGAVFGPIAWVATVMVGAAVAFFALNLLPHRRSAHRR